MWYQADYTPISYLNQGLYNPTANETGSNVYQQTAQNALPAEAGLAGVGVVAALLALLLL